MQPDRTLATSRAAKSLRLDGIEKSFGPGVRARTAEPRQVLRHAAVGLALPVALDLTLS